MGLNVGKELATLTRMSVGELRDKYLGVFGETTKVRNKAWLVRRIIWRMQALAEGDLSERARQRAAELANDADLRVSAPKIKTSVPMTTERTTANRITTERRLPIPGTIITREYKGRTLQVSVLGQGFEFEGDRYKSLSAVAKAITGSHCNGYLFFRLHRQGGAK